MKINVTIESLVLDGIDSIESENIMAALQSNLSQLVENDDNLFSQSNVKMTERLASRSDVPIETRSNSDARSIGAEIAQSIYSRIKP